LPVEPSAAGLRHSRGPFKLVLVNHWDKSVPKLDAMSPGVRGRREWNV